ncbi:MULTISPECIES: Sapep family Mn(2+)-dependent dipeptidase [unclassified Clostridioides]|uniref:Sapep family Mn(2+)-dependent dipeptidase n=1 Tax=unclassified Clostridioides TaxID=2635829 RepID=UPI001D0C09E7|nr:Sapep family Mn(2+)-dependent dipeptidase [Clostridioides sp. ES-S-0049-03]MCC0673733.1 Sapep family Mn(2+)-dependent dipeptidase [Clostridioides sp. ES-S-0145-01]MCC0676324.1 Sapep family Mn(2+)-dependent dipeptidase [Clostridioides sp. ES-W-0018-02]MCC0711475.1 Sapep family Mn(2+)-dependent dipeptidase [Clostridioides sp. ES-W-0017-02]MCC0762783.1 Sapep family Mn(2+)-dependent dipeptidase [Clostridioides sp. ES-S-0006-03]
MIVNKELIIDYLKSNQESIINDIRSLVEIPSIRDESTIDINQPFGIEIRKAFDKLIQIAKDKNFVVKDFDGYAIHIEYGEGEEVVGVLNHIDVVPVYTKELWLSNPFNVCEKDNHLYGRGVNDNKGPLVGILYALLFLRKLNIKPKRKIRLIVGGAEETTWECMEHYFSINEQPKFAFSPDGNFPIVNGEKGILYFNLRKKINEDKFRNHNLVEIKSNKEDGFVCDKIEAIFKTNDKKDLIKSLVYYTEIEEIEEEKILVRYIGERALSRNPHRSYNCAFNLAKDLDKIKGLNDKGIIIKDILNSYFTDDNHGKKLGLYTEDVNMGVSTLCIMSIFLEKDELNMKIDFRYPKGISLEFITNRINEVGKKENLIVDTYKDLKLLYVEPNSELINKLSNAYKRGFGKEVELFTKGAASYARVLENGVAFGPTIDGDIPNSHKANENISIDTLYKAIEVYIYALYNLAFQ